MRALAFVALCACGRIGFDAGALGADASADVPADAGPELGLVFHAAFDTDGFLVDSGPNHHAVTCTSCPVLAMGRVGDGAAVFDGSECLDVAEGIDLRPATFTSALWIDGGAGNDQADVMTQPFDGTTTDNDVYEIAYDSSMNVLAGLDESGFIGASVTSGWHHVAFVFDGSSQQLYIDGALGPTQTAAPPVYATDDTWIGCDLNTGVPVSLFIGAVDDVRIYSRVLAASEIAALAAQ